MKRIVSRVAGTVLAVAMISGGILANTSDPAAALARAESMTFPGGITISNFVRPDNPNDRVYCIEIEMLEPSGKAGYAGRLSILPGVEGKFPAYTNAAGIRQMNYIIDRWGRDHNARNAVATQLAIWSIRGDGRYNSVTRPGLEHSQQGRDILAHAAMMILDARKNAKEPADPKPVTGKLKITEASPKGRYVVAYPKGVTKLSVTNGTWVQNGAASLAVDNSTGSERYLDVKKAGTKVTVTASWEVTGATGYKAELFVWNTSTSNGLIGQRVAVATGKGTKASLKGTLTDSKNTVRPVGPAAVSQAQPSADVGGTMKDTLIVTQPEAGDLQMWPNAVADFTAYLAPEAGAVKVDPAWKPILGTPYQAQAENPETGALEWRSWWIKADGSPILDDSGQPILTSTGDGTPTAGTAPDGTIYPVQSIDDDGNPAVDGSGAPIYLTGREPVMEERRDPVKWTPEELAKMTTAQQCVAQPVYREGGIAVTKLGSYATREVPVKTAGTINWVDQVVSNGDVKHQSACGVANERTKIGQPAVITSARSTASLGDELFDVLHFSGKLVPGVKYEARVDAYRAPESDIADQQPVSPVCEAENRIYRSEKLPVTSLADLRMPGFTALPEHGDKIWWTHSFYADGQLIDRGACGLPAETTKLNQPSFATKALPDAVVGDELTDTIVAAGEFTDSEDSTYMATFTAYHEAYEEIDSLVTDPGPSEGKVKVPVCRPNNVAFIVDTPTEITGPGEYSSVPTVAHLEHAGKLWWVERVSLTLGDRQILVHEGECGLENETTIVSSPTVATKATDFVVVGDTATDTATISGKLSEREGVSHDLVFEGYVGDARLTGSDQATCDSTNLAFTTAPVSVTAQSTTVDGVESRQVTSPEVIALPSFGDTIWWVEKLRQKEGERITELSAGKCGLSGETTTVTAPSVKTVSAGEVMVGEEMFDTALVEGKFPDNPAASFTVTFKAYEYAADGKLTCSPETELKEFEDATGVRVTGPGEYRSKAVKTKKTHTSIGGYVEVLSMTVNGQSYDLHVGKCGAATEKFRVTPEPIEGLPVTGSGVAERLIASAAGLFLAGGMVLLAVVVRRHRRENMTHM